MTKICPLPAYLNINDHLRGMRNSSAGYTFFSHYHLSHGDCLALKWSTITLPSESMGNYQIIYDHALDNLVLECINNKLPNPKNQFPPRKGGMGVPPTLPLLPICRMGEGRDGSASHPPLSQSAEWEREGWECLPPSPLPICRMGEGRDGSASHPPLSQSAEWERGGMGVPPTLPSPNLPNGRGEGWECLPPSPLPICRMGEGRDGSASHPPLSQSAEWERGGMGVPPTLPSPNLPNGRGEGWECLPPSPLPICRMGEGRDGSASHPPLSQSAEWERGGMGVPPTLPSPNLPNGRGEGWECLPPSPLPICRMGEGRDGSASHPPLSQSAEWERGGMGVPPTLPSPNLPNGRGEGWECLPPSPLPICRMGEGRDGSASHPPLSQSAEWERGGMGVPPTLPSPNLPNGRGEGWECLPPSPLPICRMGEGRDGSASHPPLSQSAEWERGGMGVPPTLPSPNLPNGRGEGWECLPPSPLPICRMGEGRDGSASHPPLSQSAEWERGGMGVPPTLPSPNLPNGRGEGWECLPPSPLPICRMGEGRDGMGVPPTLPSPNLPNGRGEGWECLPPSPLPICRMGEGRDGSASHPPLSQSAEWERGGMGVPPTLPSPNLPNGRGEGWECLPPSPLPICRMGEGRDGSASHPPLSQSARMGEGRDGSASHPPLSQSAEWERGGMGVPPTLPSPNLPNGRGEGWECLPPSPLPICRMGEGRDGSASHPPLSQSAEWERDTNFYSLKKVKETEAFAAFCSGTLFFFLFLHIIFPHDQHHLLAFY